ncbi:MAG: universal stress protein [Pseudomonadota bacterium]
MPRDTNLILSPINLRHANLDFSAYEEAVAMARRRGAKLLVVTVAPEMERNLQITDSKEYWSKALNKFMEAYPAEGVELETVVLLGAVHRQIVTYAEARNVDVIVMGSANPGIKDYILGTTASHVVTHAKCSVYVVRS